MVNFLETLSAEQTNAAPTEEAHFEPSININSELGKLLLIKERNLQTEADETT